METLSTGDGQKIDVNESEVAFARAMAAPGPDEAEAPAPPRRAPADPEAPHGRTQDGKPKKGPGGRPPKPRTQEAPRSSQGSSKGKDAKGTDKPAVDLTQPVVEFCEGLWMLGSMVPIPSENLRVKTRLQAHVLRANEQQVATAVNMMAQNNSTIRSGVEKLTTGNAGWVLPACMALVPFAVQSAGLWKAPVSEEMKQAADAVEGQFRQEFNELQQQMTQGLEHESG